MPNWIESEDKKSLINADHIISFNVEDQPGRGEVALFRIIAYTSENNGGFILRGLSEAEAQQAIKHLATWLPSTTPRTIRMSELAQSVKGKPKTDATVTGPGLHVRVEQKP